MDLIDYNVVVALEVRGQAADTRPRNNGFGCSDVDPRYTVKWVNQKHSNSWPARET